MASSLRRAALYGSGISGAALLAAACHQRTPRRQQDCQTAAREGTATRLYEAFRPVLFLIDPERAHLLTLRMAAGWQRLGMLLEPAWTGTSPLDWLLRPGSPPAQTSGPDLVQNLLGLRFESPVGIAAGFDKNAELVPLYRLGMLPGLGFAEVGSVSARPSTGNTRPRLFRIEEDRAVVNRMGLNNEGAEAVAARLEGFAALGRAAEGAARAPVGVNLAKTHDPAILGEAAVEDFVQSFHRLAPLGDFVVLNVSCPNTEEGKTFEEPESLRALLGAVNSARSKAGPPLLLKLSPPPETPEGREGLRQLVEIAREQGVDGFVVSNTVGGRDVPLSDAGSARVQEIGRGGLSGRPLQARSTAAIKAVYELTRGEVPIVGVGGVDSAEAAYEKIRAGASLVELYSGLVFKGPGLVADIEVGLRRLLSQDGLPTIAAAVGADVPAARGGPGAGA